MRHTKVTTITITEHKDGGSTEVHIETVGPKLGRFAKELLFKELLSGSKLLEVRFK